MSGPLNAAKRNILILLRYHEKTGTLSGQLPPREEAARLVIEKLKRDAQRALRRTPDLSHRKFLTIFIAGLEALSPATMDYLAEVEKGNERL